jgi:cytochrome c-type biogenesis protein CcmH/NrfG
METTLKTSGERVHFALTVALLAACAANLVLVCSWL